VRALFKPRGKKRARVVGRGRATVTGRRTKVVVPVRLTRLGRRLIAKRPGGLPVVLKLKATGAAGASSTKSRRARLRLA
jgi:hypothetical protein